MQSEPKNKSKMPPNGGSLPAFVDGEESSPPLMKGPEPLLLVVMPGLPMIAPTWWEGTEGAEVLRLSTGQSTTEAVFELQTLTKAYRTLGKDLILLALPDEIADLSGIIQPVGIVTCHPWFGFSRSHAITVEEYSAPISGFLDLHSGLPRYHLGPNDLAPPEKCRDALLRFIKGQISSVPDQTATPQAGFVNDYQGGAPNYDALCRQLDCDPVHSPDPGMPVTVQKSHPPLDNEASVARFIHRLKDLPEGADLAHRMAALVPVLSGCLCATDFPDALDRAAGWLRSDDAALLRMLAGAHFLHVKDIIQAISLISEALEDAPQNMPAFYWAGALLYLDMRRPVQALEALSRPLLLPDLLHNISADLLYQKLYKDAADDGIEHGQALLLAALEDGAAKPTDGRQRVMIEIGTTRETIPGQGSTRQLAQICAKFGIDFITVDMDPANTRRAARMFRRLDLPFRAVTGKGEDFLANFNGVIDYAFLDAYDFDHGKHSELRQTRYEQFLGGRINDDACHQMHLECAQSLAKKLATDGLICFDDTWLDEAGAWTAKGQTAMPFLLENGFEVVEARNNAALLRRRDQSGGQ